MTNIIIVKTAVDGFGDPIEEDRLTIPVTIDQINRETVKEGTNERKGYDFVCFISAPDVNKQTDFDIIKDDFLCIVDGTTYEPAKIIEQHGFGGKVENYTLKARLQ